MSRTGEASPGRARPGSQVRVWSGTARLGWVGRGLAVRARRGPVWCGMVGYVMAGRGWFWQSGLGGVR